MKASGVATAVTGVVTCAALLSLAEPGRADVAHGKAAAAACSGCHGAGGEGTATVPRLAGLDAGYLRDQLAAYAGGTRGDATMAPIAGALDAGARADVAAYYASLPAPPTPLAPPAPEAQVAAGRELALRGDWSARVPPCASCHGRDGLGVGTAFPAIAGQPAAYAAAQIAAWKSGARHNDPQALMRIVAARLGDAQVAAVAAYYASLPGTPRRGGSP